MMGIKFKNNIAKHFYSTFAVSPETLTKTSRTKPLKLTYYCHDNAKYKSNKPPLLTFHGLLGSKKNWFNASKDIHEATGIQVIDVDARNHGGSEHSDDTGYIDMAYDIKNLLEKLKIPKVTVAGHSMGGRIGMTLALLWPEVVSSVIAVDILPLTTNPNLFQMDSLFDVMSVVIGTTGLSMDEARELVDDEIMKTTQDINIRNYILDNLVQTDTGNYAWRSNASALRKVFQTDMATLPTSLHGLQYPGSVLFTAGGSSGFIKESDMPDIQKLFPSAKVTYFEGAGHWLHTQRHKQFVEVVSKFLVDN